MHLILDGYCWNYDVMTNPEDLKRWLKACAAACGMEAVGEATIMNYPWPGRKGTALSAVQFLGESAITIHTYPEFNFVFLDVFSCKDFDAVWMVNWAGTTLRVQGSFTVHVLTRGINHETGEPEGAGYRPRRLLGY